MSEKIKQKLVLGTVQLGINYGINNSTGKPSREIAQHILKKAQQSGIQIIDTAEGYGDAIDIIAEFHANNNPFSVITKFVYQPGFNLPAHIQQLLNKLKIEKLYCLMLHKYQ